LVRHRIASYSQQSQRFVKLKEMDFVIPETVSSDREAEAKFLEALERCREAYFELVDRGIPAEDARYVLPNATPTKIVLTMNARSLINFFELRCCLSAQWEIRRLAEEMLAKETAAGTILFVTDGISDQYANAFAEHKKTSRHQVLVLAVGTSKGKKPPSSKGQIPKNEIHHIHTEGYQERCATSHQLLLSHNGAGQETLLALS
jgi:thymidylate synthase ThyX